jgi:TPR repeat protein
MRTLPHLCVALILGLAAPALSAAQSEADPVEALLESGNYPGAVSMLEARAARGDAEAISWLAHVYREGLGVPQDFRRAVELDRQAATAGVARSQNALGHSLVAGYGVERDEAAGLDWLRRAAESGEARFQFDYARTLVSDRVTTPDAAAAALWYRRAADQGLADALTNLGILYMTGDGVPADMEQALALFMTAAEAGDAQAQNNVGLLYARGDGVERDYAEAARWFTLAVEQELPQAMRNLSVLYESGQGVGLDEDRARALLARARALETGNLDGLLAAVGFPFDYRLVEPDWRGAPDASEWVAVQAGDPVAVLTRAHRLIRGGGVRRDVASGVSLLEQAAEAGMGSAEFSLCLLHANGSGVPQNFRTAYVWCSLAAFRAYPGAGVVRDRIGQSMAPEQVRQAQDELARRVAAEDNRGG